MVYKESADLRTWTSDFHFLVVEGPRFKNVKNKHLGMPPF